MRETVEVTQDMRLLLIEDVPTDAELEIRELKRAGLRVVHRVVDTEDAYREALRDFRPDLILSDFTMPHFDGMLALALARELVPDVPFIFVSGTIGEEYAIGALKNGATDYVLKNNLLRLPAAVERAMRDVHEITARRRADAQLHLQGAALDAAANAIMITHRDGTIRWVNRAFSTLTGYSAEEVVGQNPRMLKSGQHGPEFYRRMFETILSKSVWRGEIVNRYKDGRLATEEMTITPVRDQGGEITDFIAIKQDITARKAAEKHRARLSAILEASPDFVATADPDRKVLYLNSAARRLLEIPEDVDAPQVRIGDTHPPWAAELVLKAGIPTAIRDGVWSGETAFLTLGGREIPVVQVILAHKGADGSVEFLSTIARNISERKSQELRIARLTRLYAVLSGVNSAIVRITDEAELYSEICRITTEKGGFKAAYVGTLNQDSNDITIVASAGLTLEGKQFQPPPETSDDAGSLARAIKERTVTWDNDLAARPEAGFQRNDFLAIGARAAASLPFVLNDAVRAVMLVYADTPGTFGDDEVKLLRELAGDVSFALDHMAKTRQMDYLATHDQLTGLTNRTLFMDRLAQAAASAQAKGEMLAVVLTDMERFKHVNDTFGRQAGDALLRQVADRIGKVTDHRASLARVGADVFAVIYSIVAPATGASKIVRQPLEAVGADAFSIDGEVLHLAARAGVALFPADGANAEALYQNAEAALKRAKAQHEQVVFYTPDLNAKVAEQFAMESKLRHALERNEFILHYQPKVELATGRIVGLEALIRWQDPDTGLVPPMQFIPLLEETGLILEVGRWAMQEAVRTAAALRAKGLPPVRIAVNVSPIQLRQKDFVRSVEEAIAVAGDGPHGLDIEITESVIMHDIEANVRKLNEVRNMDVELGIDDFGTGYSSLAYIGRLPVGVIKIDRAFIRNLKDDVDSMSIVQTIISLTHSLQRKVVAEGVETEEQAQLLRLLRCDQYQGFLFSKPVPATQIEELLRSSPTP